MTAIYIIVENSATVSSSNNTMGMRYDPSSNPLNFILHPLSNSLANTYTLNALVYPT